MINTLVKKIMDTGIEDLVIQKHISRNTLYDNVDRVKEREARINPANRDSDKSLQNLRAQLDDSRANFALSEAAYEKAKSEQAGLISLVGLLAAYSQAGKDTTELEAALAKQLGVNQVREQNSSNPAGEETEASGQEEGQSTSRNDFSNGIQTGKFKVLEARPGTSPGTVRAYCESGDGSKCPIFAKNGNGKKLAGAIGREVSVKYCQGNKGLIAIEVEVEVA